MKLLPSLCLSLAAVFAFGQPAAQAENLFPEGTMEIEGIKGLPEGFHYPDPNWLKGFNASATTQSEEGNTFLRVNMPVAEQLVAASFEVPVPDGAAAMRVAWRVRADVSEVSANDDQSGRGVCMIASWYAEPAGVEDRGYKHGVIDQIKQSTDGWIDKETILQVPQGKKFLSIQLGTKGTAAVADFDDVVVEKSE